MAKLEFGSPGWIDALRSVFAAAFESADDHGTVVFSMSESYLDPPEHLAGTPMGWRCRFASGNMTFELGASRDVDVFIEASYGALVPVARVIFGEGRSAEVRRRELVGKLVADGTLKVTGDMTKQPAFLAGVHDAIAAVTA